MTKPKPYKSVKAKLVKLGICPCGEHVVVDKVKVGKIYRVVPEMTDKLTFVCGKCGQQQSVVGVWTIGSQKSGYLPIDLFDFPGKDVRSFSA